MDDFHSEVLAGMRELDRGVKKVLKTKSDPKDVIFFDSQVNFQKFFTAQKIELLAIIKRAKPKTIYELATLAERQFPAVLKDVKSLENYGFLYLEENKDKRKSVCPKLPFNYEQIVIELPIRGYSVSLKAA
jgi:predicted transcriptional regulator